MRQKSSVEDKPSEQRGLICPNCGCPASPRALHAPAAQTHLAGTGVPTLRAANHYKREERFLRLSKVHICT